ncbi:MAG: hypothetical protein WA784_10685, partial [Albidovulum sp.]
FRGTANRHPANLSLILTPQRHRRHPLAMFHVKHHPGNPKQPKGSSIASEITSPKPSLKSLNFLTIWAPPKKAKTFNSSPITDKKRRVFARRFFMRYGLSGTSTRLPRGISACLS